MSVAWQEDLMKAGADEAVTVQLALTASQGQWCRDEVVGLLKRFFSTPNIQNPVAYLHRGVQTIEHQYAQWSR